MLISQYLESVWKYTSQYHWSTPISKNNTCSIHLAGMEHKCFLLACCLLGQWPISHVHKPQTKQFERKECSASAKQKLTPKTCASISKLERLQVQFNFQTLAASCLCWGGLGFLWIFSIPTHSNLRKDDQKTQPGLSCLGWWRGGLTYPSFTTWWIWYECPT